MGKQGVKPNQQQKPAKLEYSNLSYKYCQLPKSPKNDCITEPGLNLTNNVSDDLSAESQLPLSNLEVKRGHLPSSMHN